MRAWLKLPASSEPTRLAPFRRNGGGPPLRRYRRRPPGTRATTRSTLPSTAACGRPNATLAMAAAGYRLIPGRALISLISVGRAAVASWRAALSRLRAREYKPTCSIPPALSSRAAAKASTVGYRSKKAGSRESPPGRGSAAARSPKPRCEQDRGSGARADRDALFGTRRVTRGQPHFWLQHYMELQMKAD